MATNMNGVGEQNFLAQNNEAPLPVSGQMQHTSQHPCHLPTSNGAVIQLHDQPSSLKLQEPGQDNRRGLDKPTISATLACSPESSSSCAQSPCESVFSPFPAPMHDSDRALLRARNVVLFGESGVGKSSLINMIAGKHITQTSNAAVGCTSRYQCYQVVLDGLSVNLWDTVGLDEGTEGTVPARQAENNLRGVLHRITRWNGIDLLLYCVRGTRVRQALLQNYDIFYAAICRKKVPVALVVTGLENYKGDMEAWWTEHEKDLIKHGMRFDAHASVTTIQSDHPAIQNRLKQSRDVLRNLVQAKFDVTTRRADEDSLMYTGVRILHQPEGKKVTPLIMICDATEQANRAPLFPTMARSRASLISDRKYTCLYVDVQHVLHGDSRLCPREVWRPDLLIFYADADSEPGRTWSTFEQFHVSFGGEMSPIIIVFGGLDNHEAAAMTWKILSSSHGRDIVANPTYYPGPGSPREIVERADEALATLVEEKCPIKFEEELTRFQKFCRHSRLFFAGRI